MQQGWVYVLVNSSIPGMAKVGRTTRPPAERAAELSATTGVATPFILAFDQEFADCVEAERLTHAELDRRGWRVATNREFFRGTPSDIAKVILSIGAALPVLPPGEARQQAETLRRMGDALFFGLGDTFQDTGEALRCYRLAASKGSAIACERAAGIFLQLHASRRDRTSRRQTMGLLKDGIRRGNAFCYGLLGSLFTLEAHQENFAKCWRLFFTAAAAGWPEEAEATPERLAGAYARYLVDSLRLGLAPQYASSLRAGGDGLIKALTRQLEAAQQDSEPRFYAAAALRWAYENLLPAPELRYLREPKPLPRQIRHWFPMPRRALA